jgi:hypothetical protein
MILGAGNPQPQMPRQPKSKQKQQAIRRNAGIAAWRMAAAEYLRKGNFMHLPKRGTPEHAAMRDRQMQLIPFVRKQIDDEVRIEAAKQRAERIARNKRIQRSADARAKQRRENASTTTALCKHHPHPKVEHDVQVSITASDSEEHVSSETGWI